MKNTFFWVVFVAYVGFSCGSSGSRQDKLPSVDSVAIKKQQAKVRKEIHAKEKEKKLQALIGKRKNFNGAILIAQRDIILAEQYLGLARLEDNLPVSAATPFQLASISKTFTSVALLILADEGKVSLDQPLQDFFPQFPYTGVTLRSLLAHRSGLPYYEYTFDALVRKEKLYPTNLDLIRWFSEANPPPKIHNLPDHYFAYNNTNFALLAAVIEKVSGMPYHRFVKERIFNPLGMQHSYAEGSADSTLIRNRTLGYEGRRKVPFHLYDRVVGDKGVFSTPRDLLTWYQSLRDGKLLSKERLQEAFTPRSFEFPGIRNYGYGFRLWVNEQQQTEFIYHTGWWKGYNTIFFFDPKYDFVIIVLSNKLDKSIYQIKDFISVLRDQPGEEMGESILDL